jgi:hypothetical protein
MPSTLENFTLSAVAAPDDFIVGYDTATLNGERRWTVSTIANAVSGIMDAQLTNDINSILATSSTSVKAWAVIRWPDGGAGVTPTLMADYNVSTVVREGTSGKSVRINFTNQIVGQKAVITSGGQNGSYLSDIGGGGSFDTSIPLNNNGFVIIEYEEAGIVDPGGYIWQTVVIFA